MLSTSLNKTFPSFLPCCHEYKFWYQPAHPSLVTYLVCKILVTWVNLSSSSRYKFWYQPAHPLLVTYLVCKILITWVNLSSSSRYKFWYQPAHPSLVTYLVCKILVTWVNLSSSSRMLWSDGFSLCHWMGNNCVVFSNPDTLIHVLNHGEICNKITMIHRCICNILFQI